MLKVILPQSFEHFPEKVAQLVQIHSKGVDKDWIRKRASICFEHEFYNLEVPKGYVPAHIIAIGDFETYGMNRNGDSFPKAANVERHHTFEKHGKHYHNHDNKDKKKAFGPVLKAAYNEDMSRIELIIGLHEEKCSHEIEGLANDKDVPFSMACKVPYDECAICGNKAKTRDEYCGHLKEAMGSLYDDGRACHAINRYPVHFDISGVFRPADRIAFGLRARLQKEAGLIEILDTPAIVSGAKMAEDIGLTMPYELMPRTEAPSQVKLDILRKLAAIEKEIEAGGGDNSMLRAFADDAALSDAQVDKLSSKPLQDVCGELADAKVLLPIDSFLRLIGAGKKDVRTVSNRLPGVFSRMAEEESAKDDLAKDTTYNSSGSPLPVELRNIINNVIPSLSLDPGRVKGRIVHITIRGKYPVKKASAGPAMSDSDLRAEALAREYAKYKVAFVEATKNLEIPDISLLTAVGNYV